MIKRFNILILATALFASSLYSYGGSVPSGLPTIYGFGCADKQDPWAPDMPNRWKDGQGTTCWDYSYQYLVPGWATWSANGAWARDELLYWEARGQIQVFTYYYSYGTRTWFQNSTNMQGYWKDLKLLFQIINSNSSKKVIVHFEPDGIGFWRQANVNPSSNGSVLVGSVAASSGVTELNGIPDSLQGWSLAIKKLRDTYAPNKALLAHHYTHWATGSDVFVVDVNSSGQSGCDSHVDNMTNYMLQIENGAANAFDLFFVDPSDRDAAWYDAFGSGGRWTADTWGGYATTRTWGRIGYIVDRVSTALGRRGMMWQIPEGNEYYTTCNNSDGHYKDDHSQEAFLRAGAGGPGDGYTAGSTTNGPGFWANKGIIATLFGSGYYGQKPPDGNNVTHVRNYKNDGITGNGPYSDDDGGYIRLGVAAYCSKGKFPLPGSTPPTPVGSPTRTRTTGPSATRTPSFTITPTFSQTPFICSRFLYDGDTVGYRLSDGAVTAGSPGTLTEVTGGAPGNAMRLNYVTPTAYWQAHKWVPPGGSINVQDNTHLRFEVKLVSGTVQNFLIVLSWSSTTYQVDISPYVTGGIDTTWKTAIIPLSVLIPASNFNEINFIDNAEAAYVVLVDNIRLTGGACPTATATNAPPTFTRTRTPTYTRTATPLNTYTYTRTSTSTPVPTVTYTRTRTPSPTHSNTAMPSATYTRTSLPSATRTWTLQSTVTFTRTAIPTGTYTRTAMPTATRTSTLMPSATRTNTLIPTVTYTHTSGPSPTNTQVVPTSTYTRTMLPTATRTNTLVPTVTYTRTSGPSPTNTVIVPSNTYTPSRTSTPTQVSTFTATPTFTRTSTALPSATFTNTVYQSPTVTNTVDLGTQPDLIITSMYITMQTIPPCSAGGEPLGTLVYFMNSGNDVAGAFDVELNGTVINVPGGLAVDEIGSVWFSGQDTQGNATAVIDYNSAVAESNEANNLYTMYLGIPTQVQTCTPVVTATDTPTIMPTATNTAVDTATPVNTNTSTALPSVTFTMTSTLASTLTFTPTPSVTRTSTLESTATFTSTPTVTMTQTLLPTSTATPVNTPDTLVLIDEESVPYPNPARPGVDMLIRFRLNRAADKAQFNMYTASQRSIRKITFQKGAVVNNLSAGKNDIIISRDDLSGIASGIYYYYIVVENGNQKVRSKIEKIIIIK